MNLPMRVENPAGFEFARLDRLNGGRARARKLKLEQRSAIVKRLSKRRIARNYKWRRQMADAYKSEFKPLLLPGFHDYALDNLRALCVDQFNSSLTRPVIMDGFERVIAQLNSTGLKMELWVNGSFLTKKLNPGDVDFAARIEEADWRAASTNQKNAIKWINLTDLKPDFRCDAYAFVELNPNSGVVGGDWEWNRAYWLRQFGFSRSGEKKGLAVLKLPFIIP